MFTVKLILAEIIVNVFEEYTDKSDCILTGIWSYHIYEWTSPKIKLLAVFLLSLLMFDVFITSFILYITYNLTHNPQENINMSMFLFESQNVINYYSKGTHVIHIWVSEWVSEC